MWIRILWIVTVLAASAGADQRNEAPPAAFAVVFIDPATERALGEFPYDRAVYARGIDALARARARGVVLKFFIDRERTPDGDGALATSMKKIKVVLQARLDDAEARPNALPDRFWVNGIDLGSVKPLAGNSGWLPLGALAENAHEIGFLDSTPSIELVPIVESYKGKCVKSLYTAALELALGARAKIEPGRSLRFGERRVALDDRCFANVRLPAEDRLEAHSFIDLLNGKVEAEALKDRVVIMGYDGEKMDRHKTKMGLVKGHRVFCYQLFSLYRELAEEKR